MDLRTRKIEKKEEALVVKKPSDVIQEAYSPAHLTLDQQQRVIDFVVERAKISWNLSCNRQIRVEVASIRQAHSDIPINIPDSNWENIRDELKKAGWGASFGTGYNQWGQFDLDARYLTIFVRSNKEQKQEDDQPMSSGQCTVM